MSLSPVFCTSALPKTGFACLYSWMTLKLVTLVTFLFSGDGVAKQCQAVWPAHLALTGRHVMSVPPGGHMALTKDIVMQKTQT